MDMTETRSEMSRIVDELVDMPQGVHWMQVRERFANDHPDVIGELGDKLAWKALETMAKDAIKPLRSRSSQLSLPGIDEMPATVTVPDGEGSYALKTLRWATAPDLDADRRIHAENVAAAIAAEDVAEQRNRILIPIMEAHGFTFAGEAIAFLAGQA